MRSSCRSELELGVFSCLELRLGAVSCFCCPELELGEFSCLELRLGECACLGLRLGECARLVLRLGVEICSYPWLGFGELKAEEVFLLLCGPRPPCVTLLLVF